MCISKRFIRDWRLENVTSEDLLWAMGAVSGDGWFGIANQTKTINLATNAEEIDFVENFRDVMIKLPHHHSYLGNIRKKRNNVVEIMDCQFPKFLALYGIQDKKSKQYLLQALRDEPFSARLSYVSGLCAADSMVKLERNNPNSNILTFVLVQAGKEYSNFLVKHHLLEWAKEQLEKLNVKCSLRTLFVEAHQHHKSTLRVLASGHTATFRTLARFLNLRNKKKDTQLKLMAEYEAEREKRKKRNLLKRTPLKYRKRNKKNIQSV